MADPVLSIAIAHTPTPSRRHLLRDLEHSMGGSTRIHRHAVRYTVITDVQAQGYAGIWPTMGAALASIGREATHHLVMQDDVIACRNYLPAVRYLAGVQPDKIIQLFSMRTTLIDTVRERGNNWWTCTGNVYTQAMIWPVAVLRDFLRWERAHIDPRFPNDDQRISMYSLFHGLAVWCTTPSLVEHVGFDRSEIGHPATKNRVARWFLGDIDPCTLDWSIPDAPHHISDPGDWTRQGVRAIRESGYYRFTPTAFMERNSRGTRDG